MTDVTAKDDLKPCPFCGPDGHVETCGSLSRGDHRVRCEICGAHGPTSWKNGGAIAAWNRRANGEPA